MSSVSQVLLCVMLPVEQSGGLQVTQELQEVQLPEITAASNSSAPTTGHTCCPPWSSASQVLYRVIFSGEQVGGVQVVHELQEVQSPSVTNECLFCNHSHSWNCMKCLNRQIPSQRTTI